MFSVKEKICTFAFGSAFILTERKQNYRDVAQLVAYYVRDVGVGSSSLLYPTLTIYRKHHQQTVSSYSRPACYITWQHLPSPIPRGRQGEGLFLFQQTAWQAYEQRRTLSSGQHDLCSSQVSAGYNAQGEECTKRKRSGGGGYRSRSAYQEIHDRPQLCRSQGTGIHSVGILSGGGDPLLYRPSALSRRETRV